MFGMQDEDYGLYGYGFPWNTAYFYTGSNVWVHASQEMFFQVDLKDRCCSSCSSAQTSVMIKCRCEVWKAVWVFHQQPGLLLVLLLLHDQGGLEHMEKRRTESRMGSTQNRFHDLGKSVSSSVFFSFPRLTFWPYFLSLTSVSSVHLLYALQSALNCF